MTLFIAGCDLRRVHICIMTDASNQWSYCIDTPGVWLRDCGHVDTWRNPRKCHIGHHFCGVLPVFSFCSLIFGCLSKYVGVYWGLALLWQMCVARPPRPKPAQWPFSYSAWLRYSLYSTFSQDTEAYISHLFLPNTLISIIVIATSLHS